MRHGLLVLFAIASLAGCDGDAPSDAGSVDDAGADAATVDDAGSDSGGPMCAEDIRAPFAGSPPCSVATADCAAACDTASCAEDCFLADANRACIQCWDANQLACWNRNGCQDEWNCIAQCITTNCPMPTGECIGANCAAEDVAYADCFEPLRMMCLERTVDCLPPRG